MKRFLKFIAISVVIVIAAFTVFEISNQYDMNILKKNISWSIVAKNCKDAVSFDKDEEGNTYIAYNKSIKFLKEDGREEYVLDDNNLNIQNMIYSQGKIYFISYDKLYEYNINNKSTNVILKDIPFEGKYMDRNIIANNGKILLSIGTATNSGVADDDDDTCDLKRIAYDKSPINITLNGINYGDEKTGAFMPYGNSSSQGQKIKPSSIGNASIIEIDAKSKKYSLYACGLRNITGWDLDSKGELIGIVGGMENVGVRPINRDFDYIYKIDKGKWYGWPDFSGGDPITSPRFKGDKIVQPLIANPPNKIVAAPLYQFNNVGTMKYLAIDKEGQVLESDTKVFYDRKDNIIWGVSNDGISSRLLKLKDESKIDGIRYSKGYIYILDSGIGCIYKLQSNNLNLGFNLPTSVWIFILVFTFILVCLLAAKFKKIEKIK